MFPLLKRRLDQLHAELSRRSPWQLEEREHGALANAFKRIYPMLSAFYESLVFFHQLAYLYKRTDFYSPLLRVQRTVLVRRTPEELETTQRKLSQRRERQLLAIAASPVWPLRYALLGWNTIVDLSSYTIPVAVFVFRLLDWWHVEGERSVQTRLAVPPYPPRGAQSGKIGLQEDRTLCALCMQPRTNPALSRGGYAFCYHCLHGFVQNQGSCPVSGIPMTASDIRRVYPAN